MCCAYNAPCLCGAGAAARESGAPGAPHLTPPLNHLQGMVSSMDVIKAAAKAPKERKVW